MKYATRKPEPETPDQTIMFSVSIMQSGRVMLILQEPGDPTQAVTEIDTEVWAALNADGFGVELAASSTSGIHLLHMVETALEIRRLMKGDDA